MNAGCNLLPTHTWWGNRECWSYCSCCKAGLQLPAGNTVMPQTVHCSRPMISMVKLCIDLQ